MVRGGPEGQLVGIRFQNVFVPGGATILYAYIEFIADSSNDEGTNLFIAGEDSANASEFLAESKNISLRPRTVARVAWPTIPTWQGAGEIHRTPNVAEILHEIMAKSQWQSGNSIVFLVDGTGQRSASSYDHSRTAAPKLVIAYLIPTLTATPSSTATATPTPTVTATPIETTTSTPTPTSTPTWTATSTFTATPTSQIISTPTPIQTLAPTPSTTHSPTPTETAFATATWTPPNLATPTSTTTHAPTATTTPEPSARIIALQEILLFDDQQNNGVVSPGDTILVQTYLKNIGNVEITNLVLRQHASNYTTLVPNSLYIFFDLDLRNEVHSQSVSESENLALKFPIPIGDLVPNQTVDIAFQLSIPELLPKDVSTIILQGEIWADNMSLTLTQDPTSSSAESPVELPIDQTGRILHQVFLPLVNR